MIGLTTLWKDEGRAKVTKKNLVHSLVFMYAAETWTTVAGDRQKIDFF